MEKLKIAITQGNYNGTTYDILLRACEDPSMMELCTPIVYGSSKHALAYRKALNVATNFLTTGSAEGASADKLTILNVAEGTSEVAFGQTTADSIEQERVSMQAALDDCQREAVDAVVLAPATEQPACPPDATELILAGSVAIMSQDDAPTAEIVEAFRNILDRDFDIPTPRIAIVQDSRFLETDFAERVTEEKGINTYGPYTSDQFVEGELKFHFDGIIVIGDPSLSLHLAKQMTPEALVRYLAGRDMVVTGVCEPADMHHSGKGVADCTLLTAPVFAAIDIVRRRAFYDEARENPLPKLYRDKREDRRTNVGA